MSVLIGDGSTNTVVDSTSHGLVVQNPKVLAQSGYVRAVCEVDSGSVTGTPLVRSPYVTLDAAMRVGLYTPMFDYTFNATTHNTGIWKYTSSTITASQSGGFLLLNANAPQNTTTTGVSMQTWRPFPLIGNGALQVEIVGSITAAPQANEVFECGLFFATQTTAPTDGAYFRYTSAGLVGCVNYNGSETTTGVLMSAGSITPNTNGIYTLVIHERIVEFYANEILLGTLAVPSGNGQPFSSSSLPLAVQFRNSGTVSGTNMQVKLSGCHVDQMDVNLSKPYPHIQVAAGLQSWQGQDGGTMGSTAKQTVSQAPGAGAALVAASAAAAFTGLGGMFAYQPTLAVNTDGQLMSYLVPAGSATVTPQTLYINGIRIWSCVTTLLAGGNFIMQYTLAYGGTNANPATAESGSFVSPTVKTARLIGLGFESFVAAAPAGTVSTTPVNIQFATPIPVNPGEYVILLAKNVGAAISTAGVITACVGIDGYWE